MSSIINKPLTELRRVLDVPCRWNGTSVANGDSWVLNIRYGSDESCEPNGMLPLRNLQRLRSETHARSEDHPIRGKDVDISILLLLLKLWFESLV